MSIRFILPSSIDADCLTGDESRLIRGEKGDHRGDLVRGAEAADRDRFGALPEADLEIVAIFAPVCADRPRGADWTGANGVDGDPDWCQVKGQRFGEADDGSLGGSVSRAMPPGSEGGL